MVEDRKSVLNNSDVSIWDCVVGTPSHTLRDWVHSYNGYREDVGRPVRRLEVSREHVILILGFGDRLLITPVSSRSEPSNYQAFVVGLGENPLITEHSGAQRCIEIEMLPWSAARLFRGASTEFAKGIVKLEDIWGNDACLLIEQLGEKFSWQERFSLVDQVLAEKFATSSQIIRPEIQWAWNQLESQGGCVSIQQLAKIIGWSDRYFATCFREQIGITPKAAARRIRFTRAHQLLTASDNYALSAIAATCGYSDQSHFTREFHLFSGCSPTIYRKSHFADLLGTPGDIIDL